MMRKVWKVPLKSFFSLQFRGAIMQFTSQLANAVVDISDDGFQVSIKGAVANSGKYDSMQLIAPSPATRGVSYAGSALPFPCPQIAFEGTPNKAEVPSNGLFSAVFKYPNSYYSHDARTKVASSVFLVLQERGAGAPVFVRFELPDQNVLRTLTHRPERNVLGPTFYVMKEDVMEIAGQEELLRRIGKVKEAYGIA